VAVGVDPVRVPLVVDLCPDCPPITLHAELTVETVDGVTHAHVDDDSLDLAIAVHVRQHVRE
jgi:hypothetical protein